MAAVSKIVAVIFFKINFIIVCVYLYMHMYITFFALTYGVYTRDLIVHELSGRVHTQAYNYYAWECVWVAK